MKFILKLIPIVTAFSLITACTPNISSTSDTAANANAVSTIIPGKLVVVRAIEVTGNTGVGTLAGAVAGGAAGSAIGGGTRANVIGAVGGALVGGMIGNAAEGALSKQTGYQYIVKTDKGRMVSVTQALDPTLAVGSCVLVMYGAKAMVISDPDNQCLHVSHHHKSKNTA